MSSNAIELKGIDFEQLDTPELLRMVQSIKGEIERLSPKETFKLYHFDSNIYLSNEDKDSLKSFGVENSERDLFFELFNQSGFHSDALFEKDHVKVNGLYYRFISLDFSGDHEIGLSSLQEIGDYFIVLRRVDTGLSKEVVNSSRKLNHASVYSLLADIEGIEAYRENEDMLRSIITRGEYLFQVEVFFFIKSVSETELTEKTQIILSELDSRGLGPKIEGIALNEVFKSFIPGGSLNLDRPILMHSSLVVNLLPSQRDELMNSGISFHSRSGRSLNLDTMNGDSYSMVVTGVTGSGKTFFVQKILENELKEDRVVLIIDPKKDYEKFALLNNATIIDASINPMLIKDSIYLKNLILSKIPETERSSGFEGRLLKTIRETECYRENDFFQAIETLEKNGFSDLSNYFEEIRDRISSNVDEFGNLIYIESGTFTDETLPFLLTFAIEYLNRLETPFKLVVDEAHRVFETNPKFLERRIREMRVKKSGIITITQKYSDLVSNYFGEVVADNSFHKVFFNQSIEVEKGIDSFDFERVNSLRTLKGEYSEFFYKSDKFRKVLRFYPGLKEMEVYKSGEEEKKKFFSYINEKLPYFSMEEAINQYVRDKYAL